MSGGCVRRKENEAVSLNHLHGKKQYTDQIRWPRARLLCLDLVPVLVVTRGVERDTAVRVIHGRTGVGCLRNRLISFSNLYLEYTDGLNLPRLPDDDVGRKYDEPFSELSAHFSSNSLVRLKTDLTRFHASRFLSRVVDEVLQLFALSSTARDRVIMTGDVGEQQTHL